MVGKEELSGLDARVALVVVENVRLVVRDELVHAHDALAHLVKQVTLRLQTVSQHLKYTNKNTMARELSKIYFFFILDALIITRNMSSSLPMRSSGPMSMGLTTSGCKSISCD